MQCLGICFGKGELDITLHNLTNCGVRHIRLPDGGYLTDQDEHIASLKLIVSSEFTGPSASTKASTHLASLFLASHVVRFYFVHSCWL